MRGKLLFLAAITSLPGCVWVGPKNPLVPLSRKEARTEIKRMASSPKPLARPVVVLGGWRSPHMLTLGLTGRIRAITSQREQDFLPISYPMGTDLDKLARLVIDKVEEKWPSDVPDETIEVDVVAHSMGGLVARLAAIPSDDHRRLHIRRLFTLATPHRGAKLAKTIAPDAAARDMCPGSDLLERLDDALETADYSMICYAHLNDKMVGARNTSPPGTDPIWLNGTLLFSHYTVTLDRRIRVDIARRLRAERAAAQGTSAPPRD